LRSGKGPLSLVFTPSNDEGSDDNAGRINGEGVIDITAASVETAPQKEAAAPSDIPADENVRLEKGRKAVKEKIKLFVKGQYVDRALEIHLCERYGAGQFEALSVANLLESWHGIKEGSEIVDKVWNLAGKLRHGVTEELPLQKTA